MPFTEQTKIRQLLCLLMEIWYIISDPTLVNLTSTPQTVYGSGVTIITFNNCMRSTDNLNLAPKHIMTSMFGFNFFVLCTNMTLFI